MVKQRKKNIRKKRDGKGFKESGKEDNQLVAQRILSLHRAVKCI